MPESGDFMILGKTVEWDESSAALFLDLEDAAAQALRVRENSVQSAYSLEIENSAGTTRFGILAAADTEDMIDIASVVTTGAVFDISVTALTTGKVLDISDLDAITTGKAIHVDATGVTQTTGILVHIDSASTALTGAGRLLLVDHTGATASSAIVAEVASAATDETTVFRVTASGALAAGVLLDLSGAAITTGTLLDAGDADALTTGGIANFVSNSADTGTRNLVTITNDNTAATGTTVLALKQDAAADCMSIDMGTLDKAFINFQATIDADATSAISSLTTSGSATHHIQISLNGTTAWIPCSTTDPS